MSDLLHRHRQAVEAAAAFRVHGAQVVASGFFAGISPSFVLLASVSSQQAFKASSEVRTGVRAAIVPRAARTPLTALPAHSDRLQSGRLILAAGGFVSAFSAGVVLTYVETRDYVAFVKYMDECAYKPVGAMAPWYAALVIWASKLEQVLVAPEAVVAVDVVNGNITAAKQYFYEAISDEDYRNAMMEASRLVPTGSITVPAASFDAPRAASQATSAPASPASKASEATSKSPSKRPSVAEQDVAGGAAAAPAWSADVPESVAKRTRSATKALPAASTDESAAADVASAAAAAAKTAVKPDAPGAAASREDAGVRTLC